MTNAQLSEQVNLSPSQCSRRRSAMENSGLIRRYSAHLDAEALGFGLRAITRVSLKSHDQGSDESFASFIAARSQIRAAYSVSGSADYVLEIHVRDLGVFAEFVHKDLLMHKQVAQVRSEIVLRTLKEDRLLPL